MSKEELVKLKTIIAMCALALLATACAGATEAGAPPSEGIAVHGDWIIETFNPDGSLDQRVEFSNDLSPAGPDLLASLLSRQLSMGTWTVLVSSFAHPENLCEPLQTCRIVEADDWDADNAHSADLELSRDGDVLVLEGSFEAIETSSISNVATRVRPCQPAVAPGDCNEPSLGPNGTSSKVLTGTTITPVDVTAGQTVAVRVEISFTSG